MKTYVQWFIRCSLLYLLVGGLLGLLMMHPDWPYYLIPSHTHLLLLGFVSMMIYGVAYHILPRFAGSELYSEKLAWWQFWLANAGVATLAVFLWLNRVWEGKFVIPLTISGVVALVSVALFVINIWQSLKPAKKSAAGAEVGDRMIADILREMPRARETFAAAFGVGCFDCPGFETETLAQACAMHGVPVERVVAALQGQGVAYTATGAPTALRMTGDGCFRCGATTGVRPLLWFELENQTHRVCVQCLPPLIHGG